MSSDDMDVYDCLYNGATLCCSVCDGTGNYEDYGTCPVCQGTGGLDNDHLWSVADDLLRLAATERAILATRQSLTEQARREVHLYLSCEVQDEWAALVWHKLALDVFEEQP